MNDANGKAIKIGDVIRPVGSWDYVGRCTVTAFTPTGVHAVRHATENEVWFKASDVRVQ